MKSQNTLVSAIKYSISPTCYVHRPALEQVTLLAMRRDRMFIISSGVCFHCICPRVPGVIKCLCARLRPLLLCVAFRPKATYSTIGLPERLQISFSSAEKNWGTLLVCVVGEKGLCQVTWYKVLKGTITDAVGFEVWFRQPRLEIRFCFS